MLLFRENLQAATFLQLRTIFVYEIIFVCIFVDETATLASALLYVGPCSLPHPPYTGTPMADNKILADATVAIVTTEPAVRSGEALLDEDVLRQAGVTDFGHYACEPGATPLPIPW